MTPPALAAQRLWMALAVGAALGLFYGFLRPLRPRLTHLADAVFVLAAFFGWVYFSFGLCNGDPRLGYTAAIALGAVLWDKSLGRLLAPVWRTFWRLMGGFFSILWLPFRKIWKITKIFCKKVLATGKKWFTIVGIHCCTTKRRSGGAVHEKKEKKGRTPAVCQKQPPGEDRHSGGGGAVHHYPGGAPRKHQ